MTYNPPDIGDIIEIFADYGFNDKNEAQDYQKKLFKEEIPPEDIDDESVKRIIKSELLAFYKKIQEHKAQEFYRQANFDDKWGHHNVMHWIFSRWFMSYEQNEYYILPEWYRGMLDIINGPKGSSFYRQEPTTRPDCQYLIEECLKLI